MAGLLPGVDCARRRRIHRGGVGLISDPPSTVVGGWSQRSASHEASHTSTGTVRHVGVGYSTDDAKLGGVAREAKARLDVKLRSSQLKHDFRGGLNGQSSSRHGLVLSILETEVFGMRKDVNIGVAGGGGKVGSKWGRLRLKSTDQEECVVCLECFKFGENLVKLKCGHVFHTRCLVPWLETNSRCPCCRMDVSTPPGVVVEFQPIHQV